MKKTWKKPTKTILRGLALALSLAYAGAAAAGSSVSVTQTGNGGNDAYVDQNGSTDSSVSVTQEGANRIGQASSAKHGVQQENSRNSEIVILQHNMAEATVKQIGVEAGSVMLGQDGSGLSAIIEQNLGKNLTIEALQSGAANRLDLQQLGVNDGWQSASQQAEGNVGKLVQINSNGVRATLEQSGSFADALVVQDHVANSSATVKQQGRDNRAYIDQRDGADLVVNANQGSGPQLLNVFQTGTLSSITADQNGSWNESRLLQSGTGNTIKLIQTGSGADLATRNIGNVDQAGSQLTANLTQTGAGQIAFIKQR